MRGEITEDKAKEIILHKNGGDRRSDGFQPCNTRLKYGTVDYWIARLRRDGHDVLAARV